MSHELPSPLPRLDRCLLRCAQKLVPLVDREDWLRTWQAELWCVHHRRPGSWLPSLRLHADLSLGLAMDALWLRTESWRRALTGTPVLCLAVLLGLCILSALPAMLLNDGWHTASIHLGRQAFRCVIAAPLVIFVTTATASSRHLQSGSASKLYRRTRQLFFAVKMFLALLLSLLLSADVTRPLYLHFPGIADLLQILFFVIFTIFGLRWAFHDQEQRCKQCLRALATPSRVGRPSHNLLEWTGTEQMCRRGHGMLSVPEMETSWRQYSQWIEQDPAVWNQAASV